MQIVYTTLIDGFVRVGELESAQRTLRDMQACGLKPNTITFNILLRGICECLDRPVEVWSVISRCTLSDCSTYIFILCLQLRIPERVFVLSYPFGQPLDSYFG